MAGKMKAVLTAAEHAALVSDDQKGLYEEGEDGKFFLSVDGIDDHASVKGMKSALQRLKQEEARLKKQLGTLPEGVTPEEIAQMVAERAEAEEAKKKAAGAWEDLKKQLNEQHAKALQKEQARVAAREAFIRKLVVENNAVAALTEAGASKHGVRLLLPHVMSSLEAVAQEDGDAFSMQVTVMGPDRKPRLSPAGNGAPMGLAEFVKEMRQSEDFAMAFEGTKSGGSGAPQSTAPGAGGVRNLADLKSPGDKAKFIAERGLDAFNQLLAADAPAHPFGAPKP
jgi:hypothetical protein